MTNPDHHPKEEEEEEGLPQWNFCSFSSVIDI
jgi:hypothetical protein